MSVEELMIPGTPIHELVFRGVVIYFALLVAFRLIGKREFGQLTPFDLILLLIVAEAISPALNADDTSITAGLIVAATLFGVNFLMGWAQFKSRAFKRLVSGEAEVLIRDGEADERLMNRERITRDEIDASLRVKGIDAIEKVRLGYLEDDGEISALLYRDPERNEQIALQEAHRRRSRLI